MTDKTLLTQAGYQQLTKELIDLKARRDRLIAQIEEVAQPDESGEDILAILLKEELGVLIEKIELLQDTLESAKIITPPPISDNKIYEIQIPRLIARADIVSDVSPYNPAEYLKVLENNVVAQARGSNFPGDGKGKSI